jgi:hypothetical protein
MSTATGSSHNGGASSTQTPKGAPHQSPPRVPLPPQELDQVLVQDWDEEAEEDEDTAEELIRVQQEIERLRQEQESIMRRQAIAQRVKARRQHINREHARIAKLQYTVDILRQ